MPCRSDYMEPSRREIELQRAANLVIYVYKELRLGHPTTKIRRAAITQYCPDVGQIQEMCHLMTQASEEVRERLTYGNARNPVARDLIEWWEEHQKADRIRVKKEQEDAAREAAFKSARAKLTEEEFYAIQDMFIARA